MPPSHITLHEERLETRNGRNTRIGCRGHNFTHLAVTGFIYRGEECPPGNVP